MKSRSRSPSEVLQDLTKIQDGALPGVPTQPPYIWRIEKARCDLWNLLNRLGIPTAPFDACLSHPFFDSWQELQEQEEQLWGERDAIFRHLRGSYPKLEAYAKDVYKKNEVDENVGWRAFFKSILLLIGPPIPASALTPKPPDRYPEFPFTLLGFDWTLLQRCFDEEKVWEEIRLQAYPLWRKWNLLANQYQRKASRAAQQRAKRARQVASALMSCIPTAVELRNWRRSHGFDKRKVKAPHAAWTILGCRLAEYLESVSTRRYGGFTPLTAAATMLRLAYPKMKTPSSSQLRARHSRQLPSR